MTEMNHDLLDWVKSEGDNLGFKDITSAVKLREQASLRQYFRIFTDADQVEFSNKRIYLGRRFDAGAQQEVHEIDHRRFDEVPANECFPEMDQTVNEPPTNVVC